MIDTIKLLLPEYSIKKDNLLTVQPSSYVEGTGEKIADYPLWQKEGGKVWGSKAYLNTEHFNLTIQPFKGTGVLAFLHFSIPKVYHGDNYYSVGREGTQAVLKAVEGELAQNGIITNLQEAKISRIDTFSNIQAEEPFLSYSPVFSLLTGSRQQRRDYGTTFLWQNTQQELCAYDKNEEASRRGIVTGTYPANTLRMEYRLLNKKKIDSTLGFSSVKELPEKWEEVKAKHKQAWQRLFKYEVGELEVIASKQVFSELLYFKGKYGRNYLDYYLKAVGSDTLARLAGVEVLKQAIENIENDRNKVYRAVKKLEQARTELQLLREEPASSKTLSTLYKELKEKVNLN